jgi:hypothetical protein
MRAAGSRRSFSSLQFGGLMTAAGGIHHPRRDLADEVEAFIARYGIAKTRFGELAANSLQLVDNIRAGRRVGPKLERRIRAFMDRGDPGIAMARPGDIGRKQKITAARNQARAQAEAEFRMHDMAELAKAFLRRESFVVFNAEIIDPRARGRFRFGTRTVSRDELLEIARKRGWKDGTEG